jgi:large subunit ribosomal protein L6
MSRIGKKPILIPENVQVKIEGDLFIVKGLKGEISRKIPPEIKVEVKENQILVVPLVKTLKAKALWGTIRAILNNMVKGVGEGFEKKLEIEGLGFRASLSGEDLELFVGFSHSVKIKASEGIKFSIEKNIITVSGIDIEKVARVASKIKKIKPPDPYKGKGIRYLGEAVRKKAGKKAITTSG